MPPWPIAMPSSTAMVLNSRGMPPAALTASETIRPTGCKWVWPGTNSVKLLAMATIGFPKSSRATPAARSKARAPAMFRPWVTVRDRSSGMLPYSQRAVIHRRSEVRRGRCAPAGLCWVSLTGLHQPGVRSSVDYMAEQSG